MIQGIIQDPQAGEQYKVTLSTNEERIYQFRGLGGNMKQIWVDVAANQTITDIPPYISHEKLGE